MQKGGKNQSIHYHRTAQVARLLQIQSVEKICKKFVTHKINLDNCLGKSIHNHQKKILVQAGFVWRTLSLVGRTLQRAFSHSSKWILPGAMTKTNLLTRTKTIDFDIDEDKCLAKRFLIWWACLAKYLCFVKYFWSSNESDADVQKVYPFKKRWK